MPLDNNKIFVDFPCLIIIIIFICHACSAVQLAASAYFSSTSAISQLVYSILSPHFSTHLLPSLSEVLSMWSKGHDCVAPISPHSHRQKVWDNCVVNATFRTLLDSATDAKSRAHILAASTKEAGAWLNVQPISSLGLRMDDVTVRVAVGLHLGTSLCHPHTSALWSKGGLLWPTWS